MTALRELAERWRGGTASHDYEMGRQECADELLSILDAEGDGGTVPIGYACPRSIQGYTLGQYGDFVVSDKSSLRSVPIFDNPQPVRSGVVSDAFRAGFIEACKWPEPVTQDVDSPAFAAALEHFAKSQSSTDGDALRLQFVLDNVPHHVLADFRVLPETIFQMEREADIDDARKAIDAAMQGESNV